MVASTAVLDGQQTRPTRNSADAISHIDRVLSAADEPQAAAHVEIAASWQRSATAYKIDPASSDAPRVLTTAELRGLREPLAELISQARDELDHLDGIVRRAHYTILLCNDRGVAVDHRGDEREAERFRYWGIWLGGVWAEDAEGTNGIGTCIAEGRPVNVHQGQHFRSRHIGLSCSAAPIFDSRGGLTAVLDVSSFDRQLSEQSHALTGALVEAAARAIEERWFRSRHGREWVIAVVPPEGSRPAMLFAVDDDQRIVGADRHARTWLLRQRKRIEDGVSLWSVFAPALMVFRHRNRGDVAAMLTPIGASEPWAALVTPPIGASAGWGPSELARWHARPRIDLLRDDRQWAQSAPARGGLPTRALRRVKDYIEENLDKNLQVATLADAAGYSAFHFARAFKESEGMTPHEYLIRRRIERAQALLTKSDLSVSQVARASGFSDQSHLARHFRQQLGLSPSMLRRQKK